MERVPGIDVSRWQGEIDWQQVAAAGYHFAVIRATIGDAYIDPRFCENWTGAEAAGILTSAYHVVTPNVPAEAQIAHFLDVLDGRSPALPVAIDVERDDSTESDGISRCVRTCLAEFEAQTGCKPIVYTARWFWNRFVLPSADWEAYDLWVASYTSEPVLPRDWETWRFWQFSERGDVPGVSARSTDLNWFAGSYEELLAYGSQATGQTSPIWHARVIDKINIRSGPGTSYEDLGDLQVGEIIEVRTVTGNDVWVEFEPGKWAAFSLKGETYMKLEKPAPERETPEEPDAQPEADTQPAEEPCSDAPVEVG